MKVDITLAPFSIRDYYAQNARTLKVVRADMFNKGEDETWKVSVEKEGVEQLDVWKLVLDVWTIWQRY